MAGHAISVSHLLTFLMAATMLPHITILLSLLPFAFPFAPVPQHVFSNPSDLSTSYRFPSVHESAILARRILNISSIATLSTIFPSTSSPLDDLSFEPTWSDGLASPQSDLAGAPIGLMDYYASCPPQPHHPIILAISIATTFRNMRAGSNVTLSLRWHPPPSAPPSDDIYTYSPANLPRFSLIGYIEPIPSSDVEAERVKSCFLGRHPDAEAWLPGNNIHDTWWGRLMVEKIYWIGGFGDRAFIGWIPNSLWSSISEEEVGKARLVGEEGFRGYTEEGTEAFEDV